MEIQTLLCDSIGVMGTVPSQKVNELLDVTVKGVNESELLETVCDIIGVEKFREITEDILGRLDESVPDYEMPGYPRA